MKQKKQRKKIKQGLGFALGVIILGLGLWSGVNADKLNARPNTENKYSSKINLDAPSILDWPFLGTGDGLLGSPSLNPDTLWKDINAADAAVPAEYSFVAMQTTETEFLGKSSNIDDENETSEYRFDFPVGSMESGWIAFSNIGFFGGKAMGIKISIYQLHSDHALRGGIGAIDSEVPEHPFLSVRGYAGEKKGFKVAYEFFYCDDINNINLSSGVISDGAKPANFKSYRQLSNLNNSKILSVRDDMSKKFLSVEDTTVRYFLEQERILLAGKGYGTPGVSPIDQKVLLCVDKNPYDIILTNLNPEPPEGSPLSHGNVGLYFESNAMLPIEIPSPQGQELVFDKLDASTDMNLQFVQQIPSEEEEMRKQALKWTITSSTVNDALTIGEWEVVDENGEDHPGWFTFDPIKSEVIPNAANVGDNASASSEGVAPRLADFYDHYYTFKRKLTIDYTKKIDVKQLDATKHLKNTGEVKLEVNGLQRGDLQNFETSINFAANVEYQRYALAPDGTETLIGDPINTSADGALTTLGIDQPLITHDAPIPDPTKYTPTGYIPALGTDDKQIVKYSIPKADGTDSTDNKQLQLTGAAAGATGAKNIVKLYYRSVNTPYDVEIQVVPEKDSTTTLSPTAPDTVRDKFVIKQGTTVVKSDSKLEAGKVYTISQKAVNENGIVQAGYKVATGEAKFEVTIDGAGKYSVTAKDPKNDAYDFEINPVTDELTITVVNKPGKNSLEVTPEINFNEVNEDGEERLHSLPLKGAEEKKIFPNHDWAIIYTNNNPDIESLALKVTLTETFENNDHKELNNILRFKSANGVVKEFDGKNSTQILYEKGELATGLSPESHTIEFKYGSKTGFFLDGAAINAAYQSGKIPIGTSNYKAELTFTLANDPD